MAQLSMEEREVISQMFARGFGCQDIAARLGRARSTISRELKRNQLADGSYSAVSAQRQTATRRRDRPLVRKLERLEENLGAVSVQLTSEDLDEMEYAMSQIRVVGDRY